MTMNPSTGSKEPGIESKVMPVRRFVGYTPTLLLDQLPHAFFTHRRMEDV